MCACSPNSGAETEDLSPGVQTQARQHCEMQGVDNGDWRLTLAAVMLVTDSRLGRNSSGL